MRLDKSFWQTHGFRVGKRLIDVSERVGPCADRVPGNRSVMAREDAQGAHEVAYLAAPTAANLEMLPVDLLVDVDRAWTCIGVVAGDDVAAAVANEVERLLDRACRSCRFDRHVDAGAVRETDDLLSPRRLGRLLQVDRDVGAHPARKIQSVGWRADCDHSCGAGDPCERNSAQSDGAG